MVVLLERPIIRAMTTLVIISVRSTYVLEQTIYINTENAPMIVIVHHAPYRGVYLSLVCGSGEFFFRFFFFVRVEVEASRGTRTWSKLVLLNVRHFLADRELQ